MRLLKRVRSLRSSTVTSSVGSQHRERDRAERYDSSRIPAVVAVVRPPAPHEDGDRHKREDREQGRGRDDELDHALPPAVRRAAPRRHCRTTVTDQLLEREIGHEVQFVPRRLARVAGLARGDEVVDRVSPAFDQWDPMIDRNPIGTAAVGAATTVSSEKCGPLHRRPSTTRTGLSGAAPDSVRPYTFGILTLPAADPSLDQLRVATVIGLHFVNHPGAIAFPSLATVCATSAIGRAPTLFRIRAGESSSAAHTLRQLRYGAASARPVLPSRTPRTAMQVTAVPSLEWRSADRTGGRASTAIVRVRPRHPLMIERLFYQSKAIA